MNLSSLAPALLGGNSSSLLFLLPDLPSPLPDGPTMIDEGTTLSALPISNVTEQSMISTELDEEEGSLKFSNATLVGLRTAL